MKPEELRLGNLVNWNRGELGMEVVEVYNITRSTVRVYTKIEGLDEVLLNLSDIEPIKITRNHFEQLGFVLADNEIDYIEYWKDDVGIGNEGGFDAHSDYPFYFEWGVDECNGRPVRVIIRHLHQLQNLFFAIKDSELK